MKKFSLNAVAAVVATFASTGAFALVDIDLTTIVPVNVANEIIATPAAPVTLTNPGNQLDIKSLVGYSLSNTEVRYIRVELANGIFKTASATSNNVNASLGVINGVGTSVIYFSITAGAGGINGTTDFVTIAGTRDITGTASNMTVSYSVYDQPSQAQAGGSTGRIVDKSGKAYINFAKSHQLAVTADSAVSDVEASTPFTAFKSGQTSGATSVARLASLDYKLAALTSGNAVPYTTAAGTAITLADLMATGASGTKLVVTGDFSAAANANGTYTGAALNRVYLAAANSCAAVALAADAVTASSATFNVGATATTANPHLCYAPRATVSIPASTYTASLNAVSAAPTVYAVASTAGGDISAITRNGTELQSPLFQTTADYVSRFVLTNTGSVAAPFTISLMTETGNTVTPGVASGSIPANSQLVLEADTVATAFTGKTRGSAVFSVARPNAQIQGVYQIVNKTSGAVSNTIMVRPGTN